jgi:hypothetical protein
LRPRVGPNIRRAARKYDAARFDEISMFGEFERHGGILLLSIQAAEDSENLAHDERGEAK